MSDALPARPLDPAGVDDIQALLDAVIDPARAACLPDADIEALARAIVAMANSRGGDLLVGAETDEQGRIYALPGVESNQFEYALNRAMELVDPPVSHLVQARVLAGEGRVAAIVHVRLSPSAPHLVASTGGIYRIGSDGVQPIRSRRALDDLYARGRGERERADRLVEAMIEKLTLSHYAFYSLAVIASTHLPSGEPYRSAQKDAGWLAPPDDPFIAAFGLNEHEPRIGPGEVELRTPGEVNAYIRVTRSGCVAAGEVQRRPYHDELDTAASIERRLSLLVATASRLLSVAGDTLMLPHVFIEGVRGLRLVRDPEKRALSGNAPQDTARHPLTVGDARDAAYCATLPAEAMDRLSSLFP
ncbi:MAG: helix-turn-helix domain-containing protein [Dehalococcoidia bacterium]